MTFFVYVCTCPEGKSYVGQTKNVTTRMVCHKYNKRGTTELAKAVLKYGWDSFSYRVIETIASREEALEREDYWIVKLRTLCPEGYNMMRRGDSPSDEARNKRSATLMGHGVSEETRKKIGDANRGRVVSEETKRKITASQTGKKRPKEFGQSLSLRQTGEGNPMFGRLGADNPSAKEYEIGFPDGRTEIITGLAEFCRNHGLTQSNMSTVASGKLNHHKGFKCRRL